jgi:hypothetical protein
MRMAGTRPAVADAAGLGTMTALYWLYVLFAPARTVMGAAWLALYIFCVACALVVWRLPRWSRPRTWLHFAVYAVVLSVAIYGAHLGLDALHGADRPKSNVAAQLGGLEFWFFLCPGMAALALGGWARNALYRSA